MGTDKWTKKDKIACSIVFVVSVVVFVVFFSTMTLAYFFDTHTASDVITAGQVSIKAIGGPNNDGQIKFPEVLTPNTQYSVNDSLYMTGSNQNLAYAVQNTGAIPIYVMVKVEGTYLDYILPTTYSDFSGTYWAIGSGFEAEDNTLYFFYMSPVTKNMTTRNLCSQWQTKNFTNAIAGEGISIKITAYAVQTQGDAVKDMIQGSIDGWQYAPQLFKTNVGM